LKDNIKEQFNRTRAGGRGLVTYGSEKTKLAVLGYHDDKYVGFIKYETLLPARESITLSRVLLHRVNWSSDNSMLMCILFFGDGST